MRRTMCILCVPRLTALLPAARARWEAPPPTPGGGWVTRVTALPERTNTAQEEVPPGESWTHQSCGFAASMSAVLVLTTGGMTEVR